ncbi:MraZ protein [Oscillochloris trichoides DG-6]|uniref:Transcriptional regulator MraZ n=1 Tax=Oscillochloris trichoides DG-6 TaxID=765420 RepID=E1IHH1_9CHLR|nr:division/cell wall cluster transcriptional repressor MraZ [Oscillochloris trichoides]EFO79334.1 MraZ protein [Oscillochloris trichoides DG-6]
MFLGEFEHSIDDKGRVAIPARFREELSEGMVLTRGFDACLQAFPRAIWQQLAQKVSSLSLGSPEARTLRRMLFSNAAEVEVDRQGRILVPQNLREYAGLAEQVVISGMDTYFELWSADRWRNVMEQLDTSGAGIAAQLAAVGI